MEVVGIKQTYNVSFRDVRVTTVAVNKQQVLHILNVSLYPKSAVPNLFDSRSPF